VSALSDLLEAFAQWRAWTEVESAALQDSNWALLASCHSAKEQLQPRIAELSDKAELNQEIRSTVAQLLALEASNADLLKRRLAVCRARASELRQAGHNLVRVHRSYGALRPAHTSRSF
jgi:hypothetical protein